MTVQIEIDEKLISKIDAAAQNLKKSRLDYINEALLRAVRHEEIEAKIRRHYDSYKKFPVQPDEFEIDEEQLIEVWKDL